MGQNRKLEVLGWGLVINWDDNTCVAFNGNTCVCTTNDAIEVRAFNPKSNIQAWIDAKGLLCHNMELLVESE